MLPYPGFKQYFPGQWQLQPFAANFQSWRPGRKTPADLSGLPAAPRSLPWYVLLAPSILLTASLLGLGVAVWDLPWERCGSVETGWSTYSQDGWLSPEKEPLSAGWALPRVSACQGVSSGLCRAPLGFRKEGPSLIAAALSELASEGRWTVGWAASSLLEGAGA